MIDFVSIRRRFESLSPYLGERERRLFAATEAKAAGFGGIAAVSQITGIAVNTIGRGLKELAIASKLEAGRVRRPGGGCKPLVQTDESLLRDLLGLVWNPMRAAIRCRRCDGRAKACASLQPS